jgi:FkbM family methyltransferase
MLEYFKRTSCAAPGKINFIDIGSAGKLPEPWDKSPGLIDTILKFEPRESDEPQENVISLDAALWEEKCEKNFYIYKGFNSTGSSLFLQNFKYVRENWDELKNTGPQHFAETWVDRGEMIGVEKIKCDYLDNVLKSLKPKTKFDFLKIDAQGAEHQILKGATKFLNEDCIGLVLELFRIPLYEGISLFDDVVDYLDKFGFYVARKFPPHGTFDSQNDCLFLKKDAHQDRLAIIEQIYDLKK